MDKLDFSGSIEHDDLWFRPSGNDLRIDVVGTSTNELLPTLAKVPEMEPVILLAHEPDIMPQVPARVALVLSGHTHGGQLRLFG